MAAIVYHSSAPHLPSQAQAADAFIAPVLRRYWLLRSWIQPGLHCTWLYNQPFFDEKHVFNYFDQNLS